MSNSLKNKITGRFCSKHGEILLVEIKWRNYSIVKKILWKFYFFNNFDWNETDRKIEI